MLDALVLTDDFELNGGGFTIAGTNPSWGWGTCTYGPGVAHSGSKVWATGLTTGAYNLRRGTVT